MFLGHHLIGRGPLGAQPFFEPGQGRHDRRVLATKPLDELHCERAGQGGVAQTAQHLVRALHPPIAQAQQAVRQLVGPGPRLAGADDQLRQPAQVLHESHAEMDGDRPELPDGQRLDTLVGPDESLQRLQLEAAVGMGDVGPGQPIDARVSREVARGDLRQQAVVAPREVVPDPPELFVHDVEVVEDPLRGGRDLVLRQDGRGDVPVPGQKHVCIVANPGEEIPSFGELPGGAMGRGQALGVLLQALDAEELGTDRFFRGGGLHFELPSRDVERVLPFLDPGRFGTSGLDRLQASSWTRPGCRRRP